MNTYKQALWLALAVSMVGCGDQGFDGATGSSTFRGGSSVADDKYATIFLSQGEANSFSDNFVQGESHEKNQEAFVQGEKFGALDIMLVIDNSGSMEQEQANLSTKLQPLLSRIRNSDWNIGITSTDVNDGCDYLITKQTNQPNQSFRDAIINMGITGDGVEAGLYKAAQGLSNTCGGQNWVRNDSTVAVLIVSDEDNCSNSADTTNCRGTGSGAASYLTDFLSSIRTPGQDAKVYGIISEPSNPCADADNPGVVYSEAIAATGGQTGSICDPSYANTLTTISENISKVLNGQFKLRSKPVEASVVVKVDGKEISKNKYKVTKNGVTFIDPPSKGSKVSVQYRAKTGALNKSFKLSKHAIKDGVAVFVDGEELDGSTYYIDEMNQTIVFDSEPEIGSNILVEFDADGVKIKRFMIKKGLDRESMTAIIGGDETQEFKYDPRTGVIDFDSPPSEGDEILIRYRVAGE